MKRKDSPLKKNRLLAAAEFAATAAFWALWLYIITPLLTIVLWIAGVHVFDKEMLELGGYELFVHKLSTYGVVVLLIMLVCLLWVTWNVKRYSGRNARVKVQTLSTNEIAAMAGIEAQVLDGIQKAKRLVVDFDEKDRLLVVG